MKDWRSVDASTMVDVIAAQVRAQRTNKPACLTDTARRLAKARQGRPVEPLARGYAPASTLGGSGSRRVTSKLKRFGRALFSGLLGNLTISESEDG